MKGTADMLTLTKTRIEIGDRHTSLFFLKKGATPDPLGFGGPGPYSRLYKKIAGANPAKYSDLTGKPGRVLGKLYSLLLEDDPDGPLMYWVWYLGRRPEVDDVWVEAIPILSSLNYRVEIQPPAGFPAKVRLVPQVLLYPFGWTTWLSILVSGGHTIKDLSSLVAYLFQQSPFASPLYPQPFTLSAHFDFVAKGIRVDAFGAAATRDTQDGKLALVVTVLEKGNGSPGVEGLGAEGEEQLRALVRPTGSGSRKSFNELVFHFYPKGHTYYDLKYLVADQLGRFLWMEDLLQPVAKNQRKLECYHRNSFRSLIQAWHFDGLVKYGSESDLFQEWKKSKKKTVPVDNEEQDSLASLMTTAFGRLKSFGYKNASLRAFLEIDSVQQEIKASRAAAVAAGLLAPASSDDVQPGLDKR
jgi:hypothetical protein